VHGQRSRSGCADPARRDADDGLEALRALCVLSWTRMDRGQPPLPTSVLEQLGPLGRW
jgi:hypothetical protein